MGGELQPPLVTLEWIGPQLIQSEKRIGGDDQRALKIKIGFGMQVEQIIGVDEDHRVRTMFANFAHKKDAILQIGRRSPPRNESARGGLRRAFRRSASSIVTVSNGEKRGTMSFDPGLPASLIGNARLGSLAASALAASSREGLFAASTRSCEMWRGKVRERTSGLDFGASPGEG